MKVPSWFRRIMAFWLVLGLPLFLLGSMWSGGFDPIMDEPPYFQAPYEDRSFEANATWAVAVTWIYMPLFLFAALGVRWWRKRKRDG